ncbi:MAG: hypothetical protein GXY32_06140 [Ruminococcaceae bacterium]|nr:hypothetical protein [Oscillospiraceae bacterium]
MAEFDQDRGIRNAGSGIIPEAKAKQPPRKNYVPEQDADPLVKEAYKKTQEATREAVADMTEGKQAGFTKSSVDGVLEARQEGADKP